MKHSFLIMLLALSLLLAAAGYAPAYGQQDEKSIRKEQKQIQKEQKKKMKQEIRYYEALRNDATVAFAKKHQPTDITTPLSAYCIISKIICAGDKQTGTVMLHFTLTPLQGGLKLFMGGSNNGTQAIAGQDHYNSDDLYGRIYDFRSNSPETIIITLRKVKVGTPVFNQFDISMGLQQNIMNLITMRNVPIFWTNSDRAIRDHVKTTTETQTKNN